MTTEQLHKILDNNKRKISKEEFANIIYELKEDVSKEHLNECCKSLANQYKMGFYVGETNAFYIVLDLIEHLI